MRFLITLYLLNLAGVFIMWAWAESAPIDERHL